MPQLRRILSCDGGGIRGIITLRCLEALETRIGPCGRYFDMFAGTSTGALIAGALAHGMPVSKLIELYTERRADIFSRRLFGCLHPLVTKYHKKGLHRILCEYFGDVTLAQLNHDILITAVDTVRSETIYFSSFRLPAGAAARHGTYQKVRLRDAIEASASAPTFFAAHGRFIDGGTTVYNNPAYVAAVEALRYSSDKSREPPEPSRYDDAVVEVYSFGTGFAARAMEPDEAIDPETLALDAIDDEAFDLMDALGRKYGAYLFPPGFAAPAPPSASAAAQRPAIVRRTPARGEWHEYGKPPMPPNYVNEVLAQLDEINRKLDSRRGFL